MISEISRRTQNLTGYYETRMLSRSPSPAIIGLEGFCSYLYSKGNPFVCSATPMNFIGAMIVELIRPQLNEMIMAGGFDPNNFRTLQQPVKLVEGAQILYPCETGLRKVPYLLHKADCGNHVGVVLTGDLAGLLVVTTSIETNENDSLVPFRVWNDSCFANRDIYQPKFSFDLSSMIFTWRDNNGSINPKDLSQQALILIKNWLTELKGAYQYTSEAFFGLCHDILPPEVVR